MLLLSIPFFSGISFFILVAIAEHFVVYVHVELQYQCKVQITFSPVSFLLCREPRGFGFVQYLDPDDAADAKYHMDGQILHGRELTVVFAEENRKKPAEMRSRQRSR